MIPLYGPGSTTGDKGTYQSVNTYYAGALLSDVDKGLTVQNMFSQAAMHLSDGDFHSLHDATETFLVMIGNMLSPSDLARSAIDGIDFLKWPTDIEGNPWIDILKPANGGQMTEFANLTLYALIGAMITKFSPSLMKAVVSVGLKTRTKLITKAYRKEDLSYGKKTLALLSKPKKIGRAHV